MLRINHQKDVAKHIREKLDASDQFYRGMDETPEDIDDIDSIGKFEIGSKLKEITFAKLIEDRSGSRDPSFTRFHFRLAQFLNQSLAAHGIPYPEGKPIAIKESDKVSYENFAFNFV